MRKSTSLFLNVTVILSVLLSACNEKQKIGNAAGIVLREGNSIRANAQSIQDEIAATQPDLQSIHTRAELIENSSDQIIKAAEGINEALPGVQNVPGFFGKAMTWWCLIGSG
jgi:hypothetical protein